MCATMQEHGPLDAAQGAIYWRQNKTVYIASGDVEGDHLKQILLKACAWFSRKAQNPS